MPCAEVLTVDRARRRPSRAACSAPRTMSRNVERIFTRLQALCDENFGQCQQDFVAHETWLCETFKANALQQLKSRKVELACPTSAKKQKKTHAAAAQPEQVRAARAAGPRPRTCPPRRSPPWRCRGSESRRLSAGAGDQGGRARGGGGHGPAACRGFGGAGRRHGRRHGRH